MTARGHTQALRQWFRNATEQHPVVRKKPCQGGSYYFSGFRRPDGDYIIVVSPTYEPAALAQYRRRRATSDGR